MQRMKKAYYNCACILLCFSGTSGAMAQNTPLKKEDFLKDYVFKGNHIQFNSMAMACLNAKLVNQSGNHPVSSKPALGLSIGLKYRINFSNTKSLIIGPEAIILGRTFITSFKKNDFSPPMTRDYNIKGIKSYVPVLVISLPVIFEGRRLYAKTKHLFAGAGAMINFSTGADFESMSIILQNVNNQFFDVGGTMVYANNDAKPWISFPLSAGHSWLLKNNNLLQLAVCSNTSFTKYVNGTYQINIPGQPLTKGAYSSTGSYVGLSLNYVFTSANYRIRKAYEKNIKRIEIKE
jgi:hypothetical protein